MELAFAFADLRKRFGQDFYRGKDFLKELMTASEVNGVLRFEKGRYRERFEFGGKGEL